MGSVFKNIFTVGPRLFSKADFKSWLGSHATNLTSLSAQPYPKRITSFES
jgi:hypothetical protein